MYIVLKSKNMADNLNSEAVVQMAIESPKAKKIKTVSNAVKKQRVKPTHPPTSEMVNNAVKSLKERGGSSLQAIKKYLANNYKIDSDKLSPFIKKYLKSAVTNGTLIQTKGKGASGSFKLAAATKSKSVVDKSVEKKVKKSAVTIAKKKSPVTPKKVIAKKQIKKSVAAKTATAKSPKQKSTKATKSIAVKKTPKPKKTAQKKTIAKKIVLKKK